uniref:Uncharacterized protein n=1 Tax=Cucumis melo TaxID=3656 RepID=A0A9I9CI52_CUCME
HQSTHKITTKQPQSPPPQPPPPQPPPPQPPPPPPSPPPLLLRILKKSLQANNIIDKREMDRRMRENKHKTPELDMVTSPIVATIGLPIFFTLDEICPRIYIYTVMLYMV